MKLILEIMRTHQHPSHLLLENFNARKKKEFKINLHSQVWILHVLVDLVLLKLLSFTPTSYSYVLVVVFAFDKHISTKILYKF